jgi:hypothetical protein
VKIRERERLEPPHATVMRRTMCWRWDLREGKFMNPGPDPAAIPAEVVSALETHQQELRDAWDEMYPENPIKSEEG